MGTAMQEVAQKHEFPWLKLNLHEFPQFHLVFLQITAHVGASFESYIFSRFLFFFFFSAKCDRFFHLMLIQVFFVCFCFVYPFQAVDQMARSQMDGVDHDQG